MVWVRHKWIHFMILHKTEFLLFSFLQLNHGWIHHEWPPSQNRHPTKSGFFFRFFYFFQLFLMVVNPNFNFITRNKMSDSVKLKKTWARPWPQNKTKNEEFFSWTNISKCSSSLTTAVKLSTPFIYIILSTKYPKVFFEWQK